MKEIVFYVSLDKQMIGYRQRFCEWKVGDIINTEDGKKKCEIIAVSTFNPALLRNSVDVMLKACRKVFRGTHHFNNGMTPAAAFAKAVDYYCMTNDKR